jgi:exportin-1
MCFVVALLQIPPAMFKLYVDSVIWGFKHTMRNVAEISLNILYTLMQKFSVCQDIASAGNFFKLYFLDLMQHVFAVVTDTSHTASLTMHATILAFMFQLVEEDKIPVPLYDQMTVPAANNALFVNEYVTQLIKQAFSHLTDAQIKVFIEGLFFLNKNILGFKEHLRDFLVQIKEYTGEDSSDLYLEERERQLLEEQQKKRQILMDVPGMINPHDRPDEMQE